MVGKINRLRGKKIPGNFKFKAEGGNPAGCEAILGDGKWPRTGER